MAWLMPRPFKTWPDKTVFQHAPSTPVAKSRLAFGWTRSGSTQRVGCTGHSGRDKTGGRRDGSQRLCCRNLALVEQVLHLLHQRRGGGLVVHRHGLGQLGHQLALGAAELSGHLDQHLHNQVAAAVFVKVGNALAADSQLLPVLSAFRDLDCHLAVDGGNLDLRAQCGLRKADGDYAMQILAVALEKVVRLDGEDNIEIASRSAIASCVAFAGVADACAVLNAGWDFDVELQFLGYAGLAAAGLAGIAHDGARSAAGAAGAGHGEEALLVAHLAPALALAAGGGTAARSAASAIANAAGLEAANLHFGLRPEHGGIELNRQVETQIVSALLARAALGGAAHVKHLAEQVAEDVADVYAACEG